jgi:arylsulfatase A-like enzyme
MKIQSRLGIRDFIDAGSLAVCGAGFFTLIFYPYGTMWSQAYFSQKLYTLLLGEFLTGAGGFLAISALALIIGYIGSSLFGFLQGRLGQPTRRGIWRTGAVPIGLMVVLLAVVSSLLGTLGLLKSGIDIVHSTRTPELFVMGLCLLIGLYLVLPGFRKVRGSRYPSVMAVLFLLLYTGAFLFVTLTKAHRGANVVVIVVDTLRSDHTVVGDYHLDTTPALQASLAAAGVSFDRCYANSSWTLPSIASLLTGQYPSRIGMNRMDSRLEPRWLTLAELLKDRGYHTGAVISHVFLKAKYGLAQGFDIYDEEVIDERRFNHFSVTSGQVTDKALRYLRDRGREKFFLFLHYFDPHQSYYDHEGRDDYQGRFRWGVPLEEMYQWIAKGEYGDGDIEYLRRCYDSEIRHTDRAVGEVIEELKRLGLYDQTLIVFTSDHGEEFVERGFQGHGTSLYEEQIRVPLVVKPAGETAENRGRRNRRPVANLDIFPTVVRCLRIRHPQGLPERDLLAADLGLTAVFAELNKVQFGEKRDKICLIQGDWKLIHNLDTRRLELYNLREDPDEKTDLSGIRPSLVHGLRKVLDGWIKTNRGGLEKGDRISLSPEERKRLRSLGYF